ncbi:TonB-dependent receptor [Agrobacterium sp. V1]|uniref:TonB-dependent receptor domain-containing protein n=1 Tax=Agrobacterium sp. V1 TaxID=3061957 RepID=UPI0026719CD2|nr:TonB-dependent receptor [Agrobacterium sp. V1]MDO3444956.1 TonB-dependent receptor [Agrobacterium sp. V1]
MNRRCLLHTLMLAASVSGGAIAKAQTIEPTTTVLDPIVVTTTSGKRFLQDAPASVTVVTGEELRERPVHDLAAAVEGTPGVQITGVGLGRKGISIRGMLPDQTLVLVDGMRISGSASAIAHSDFELGWVPAEAIERVEVVRGPMSSLYGSESLGGVVNIITRSATDKWHSSFSTLGTLPGRGLGGDGYNFSAYAGGPIVPGVLGLNLWGAFKGRTELASGQDVRISSMNDEKAFMGNAALTWTPDERQRIDLSYGAGFEERWRNSGSGTGRFPTFYRSDDDIWRQRISLSHQGDWDWGSSRVRIYNSTLERKNRRSDGAPTSDPQELIDTVGDAQVSFSPFDSHRFTVGTEVRQERLRDTTVNRTGRADQMHYAGFIQDEISLGEKWEMVLGGRFDHHEAFGWHASPRAYLLYHADEALTFKGGVGAGFKAPTLKQLSAGYEAIGGGGRFTIVGNPDLEPETNLSFEAGVEYQRDIWSAHATVFQNDVENLIQTVCILRCDRASGAVRTYENVDKARIRGIELGGGVELPWDLKLDVNYTFLDPFDRTTGERLPDRSKHMANATLAWSPLDNLTTSFKAQYVGTQDYSETIRGAVVKRERPDYVILSAYADYQFHENASLQFGVENITDVRLADETGGYTFVDEGRRYFVGLRATF